MKAEEIKESQETEEFPEETVFSHFLDEFHEWEEEGREPASADGDCRFCLKLQKKRLDEMGIRIRHRISPVGHKTVVNAGRQNMKAADGKTTRHFHYCSVFQNAKCETVITKDGKRLCRNKKNRTVYQRMREEEPNLWGEEKVTKRLPEVTACYSIASPGMKSGGYLYLNPFVTVPAFVIGIIAAIAVLITEGKFDPILELGTFLLPAALVFTFNLMLAVTFQAFRLVFRTIGSMFGIAKGGIRSPAVRANLKDMESHFEIPCFETMAYSAARILLMSGDPSKCAFYQGPELPAHAFSEIADVNLQDGMKVTGAKRTETETEVTVKLPVLLTRYNGKRIRVRKQTVTVTLFHENDCPEHQITLFSETECPDCAESYCPAETSVCPHCGRSFRPGRDGWGVEEIRIS